MGLRQWTNENPKIATGAAAALLVVAVIAVVIQWRGPSIDTTEATVYFWDVEEDKVFEAHSHDRPPIKAPSSGEGVRAHLFTCGQCVSDDWFGYLETYTAEGLATMARQGELVTDNPAHQAELRELARTVRANHLVRPLDGDEWVIFQSAAGTRVRNMQGRCDDGATPQRCTPGDS